MKLSQNSWHAWVYQFFYGFENDMPNNLCPYFWKFILSLVLFVPCFLIELPTMIIQFVMTKLDKADSDAYLFRNGSFTTTETNPLLVGVGANAIIILVSSMLVTMWFDIKNAGVFFAIGCV